VRELTRALAEQPQQEDVEGSPVGADADGARRRVVAACDEYLRALREQERQEQRAAAGAPSSSALPASPPLATAAAADAGLAHEGTDDEAGTAGARSVSRALVVSESPISPSKEKSVATAASTGSAAGKKPRRSILFGATMGLVVAAWVFSGNYIFTTLFTLMTVLGQLEYYRMVQSTGVYPARRISIVGACSMYLTALFTPNLHQICLPIFGLWSMVWFLTMRRTVTTIPEIATTFTGMFYLGYVPSFWVRIRLLDAVAREPTQLAPLAAPVLDWVATVFGTRLPLKVTRAIHLPITTGAVFIFWTWLCLAFSDVGAYFVGRRFGRTKLGAVAPAAGATSPNKSVEGVLGGCAVSAALAVLGAWVMKWPCFVLTGAVHGVALGILGLIGDLTASMLKRDAGLKDFGDLIPEHGGIMDRVDSFVWAAPYSYVSDSYHSFPGPRSRTLYLTHASFSTADGSSVHTLFLL
jgi:CDP-diglyceride synthetase